MKSLGKTAKGGLVEEKPADGTHVIARDLGTFRRTAPRVPNLGRLQVLRACQRRTPASDALIASTCLSGTDTRRVRLALTLCSAARLASTW